MKKRLTKKDRHNEARKKIKKLRKIKKVFSINIPDQLIFSPRKAVLFMMMSGISLAIIINSLPAGRSFLTLYKSELGLKTAQAYIEYNSLLSDDKAKAVTADLPIDGDSEIKASPLYKEILPIIKNTPMEKMSVEIAKRERPVAAFLVGIAMKESKFGVYSPKKNGGECYNYWGYRGRENTTASGYSCFNSPEHAIKVVGDRIEELFDRGAVTPAKMITWKCGYSCAGHSPESVKKWIADVSIHYYRIFNDVEIAKK